jgi:hypothetical protein
VDPGELPATLPIGLAEQDLGLHRHPVHHEPPVGPQRRQAGVEHPRTGAAATDEHSVGGRQAIQSLGCAAVDDLQAWDTESSCIAADSIGAYTVRLDGDRATRRMCTHPLDADGARTRSHIPEELARRGHQAGQRRRAQIPFRELAIVFEHVVRQLGMASSFRPRVTTGHPERRGSPPCISQWRRVAVP